MTDNAASSAPRPAVIPRRSLLEATPPRRSPRKKFDASHRKSERKVSRAPDEDLAPTADSSNPSNEPSGSDDSLEHFVRTKRFKHFSDVVEVKPKSVHDAGQKRQRPHKKKRPKSDYGDSTSDEEGEAPQPGSTRKPHSAHKHKKQNRCSSEAVSSSNVASTVSSKSLDSSKSRGSSKTILSIISDGEEEPATPTRIVKDTAEPASSALDSHPSDSNPDPESTAVGREIAEVLPPANVAPKEDEFQAYIDRALALQLEAQKETTSSNSGGARKPSPATAADVVEVLVTSPIEGAIPFRANIRLTQPLRVIRSSWEIYQKHRAGLDLVNARDDVVIITWSRKRIYDTTTLHSLGVRVANHRLGDGDDDGNENDGGTGLSTAGRLYIVNGGYTGLSKSRSRVMMEAWTNQLYDEYLQTQEKQRRYALGEGSDETDDNGDGDGDGAVPEPGIMPGYGDDRAGVQDVGSVPSSAEPRGDKIRVQLQARGGEPVRAGVRSFITMETLVNYYRRERNVEPGKEVWLAFDGERLEEHVTVEEAGVEDKDVIEVYVR